MALLVKRAGAAEYGQFIKALVAADPGAGKTRQASTWPNPLYLNVEGGLMSVADRAPLYVDVSTSKDLEEIRRELIQQPSIRETTFGAPIDTVVIDTFDELAKIFMAERLRSEGKDTMAIADWGWLGDQLRGVLRGFRNLHLHVIVNVHLKLKTDEESGAIFYQPSVQGSVGEEIAQFFDLAVLLKTKQESVAGPNNTYNRVTRRFFQTFQDTKHPWVKDRSGRLPGEFPINFDDDFARLHDLIYANAPTGGGDVTTIGTAVDNSDGAVPEVPSNIRNQPAVNPLQSTLAQGAEVEPEMLTAAVAKKEILAQIGDPTDVNKDIARKVWGTRGSKQISRRDLEGLKEQARIVTSPSTPEPVAAAEAGAPTPTETPAAVVDETDLTAEDPTAALEEGTPVSVVNVVTTVPDDVPNEPGPAEIKDGLTFHEVSVAEPDEGKAETIPHEAEAEVTPESEPAEVPVEIADGMKHMPACPNHQTVCEFDPEITPLADLRFGHELCHACYAAAKNAPA